MTPITIAAVPGLPSAFTAEAQAVLGLRHIHEPLAIGVAVMAARALVEGRTRRLEREPHVSPAFPPVPTPRLSSPGGRMEWRGGSIGRISVGSKPTQAGVTPALPASFSPTASG